METIEISVCPNCKSENFSKLFIDEKYDNDLFEFSRNNSLREKYPELNFDELSQSSFSICRNCMLVFSAKRRKEENMYSMEFFADVQKRWYAQYPVPQKYIDQHKKLSKNFINILNKNSFSLSPEPKVLWLRTECGVLTNDLLKDVNKENVYIMEYFDSNIRFLKEHGYMNVEMLPPGDFVDSYKESKFTEIFINHQLTHSFDPTKLIKTLLDMLGYEGRIIFYNEIDHFEANKMNSHYPRGINNFHNQLFTRNSLSNFLKTVDATVEFFEPLEPLKNASVHSGMFGVIKKDSCINENPSYMNSDNDYKEEIDSFRNWMQAHKIYSRNLKLKKLISKVFLLTRIKEILKNILIRLGLLERFKIKMGVKGSR